MPYNILLLPLLGGFLFVSFWDRTRWHAFRAEKDRLLLYAALAGLVFLGVAFVLRSIPPFIPCWSLCPPTWWDAHVGFPHSGVATFAFLLGALGWWPANRLADLIYKSDGGSRRHEFARVVRDHGGPLEQMLLRAMDEDIAIMITLKSGKVYIGGLAASFTPEKDKTISLLPTKSGYRESELHRLVLTTHYDEVYEKIALDYKDNEDAATQMIGAFGVVIPLAEILSATLYLPEVHAKYFPHHDSPHDGPRVLTP
jgi:hypothetical protein